MYGRWKGVAGGKPPPFTYLYTTMTPREISERRKMTIQFFIPCKPPTKTHQMKKVRVTKGKPIFYEPQEVLTIRQKFMATLKGYAPATPITGPVRLLTKWCYPRGTHDNGEWKTTKPDTDNMIKLFKDCMTATGYWKDDAQVCSELTEKFWSEIPGIFVHVEVLE